eukprot:m.625330 g.625330  ORF g.625330 m.625330 type:complete len:62 (-) comp58236_c1_seq6:261-446(-)
MGRPVAAKAQLSLQQVHLGRTREVSWSNKVTQGTDQAYRCMNSDLTKGEQRCEHMAGSHLG